jgi:hypothetical protein
VKQYLLLVCLLTVEVSYSQQVVYPLHAGDRWEYGNAENTSVIRDTIMFDGNKYSIIVGLPFHASRYERQIGDSVFEYLGDSLGSRLIYDFTRSVGDTLYTTIAGSDTFDLVLTYFTTDSIFGRKLRRWTFVFVPRHHMDLWYADEVTDSIGVTSVSKSDYIFSNILGAVINGIQYGTITDVHSNGREYPTTFSLSQNYPNPFNPTTTLSFVISQKAFVTLKIYDILGREIATVINQELTPDSYSKEFDATSLSSGVYIYRLTALHDNQLTTLSQKMMLLK